MTELQMAALAKLIAIEIAAELERAQSRQVWEAYTTALDGRPPGLGWQPISIQPILNEYGLPQPGIVWRRLKLDDDEEE